MHAARGFPKGEAYNKEKPSPLGKVAAKQTDEVKYFLIF